MDDYDVTWNRDDLPDELQPHIRKLVRTCDACPTQYDIVLSDGRHAYFRYRHGDWRFDVEGETVDSGAVYQLADGYLSHDEVLTLITDHLLPAIEPGEPCHFCGGTGRVH